MTDRRLWTLLERLVKSCQGWIMGTQWVCSNSKAARPIFFIGGIALRVRMRGALVLDTLLTISAEVAEMRKRLPFTYWVHAGLSDREERSTWATWLIWRNWQELTFAFARVVSRLGDNAKLWLYKRQYVALACPFNSLA